MKKLIVFVFVLLAGCASTAPSQFYRAQGEDKQIAISGVFEPLDGLNGSITITLDGQKAVYKKLDFSMNFEAAGKYQDKAVSAVCNKQENGGLTYSINCLVLIDNERAATLVF
jgi:hypothetical protein